MGGPTESWWRSVPDPLLTTGDVLRDIPRSRVVTPAVALSPAMWKGNESGWRVKPLPPAESTEPVHLLGTGTIGFGVIVSHSCDIAKPEKKVVVLMAPVARADRLAPETHRLIFARKRRCFLPLSLVPEIGDAYADLRLIAPVEKTFLESAVKLASMTPTARVQMREHLVGFICRNPGDDEDRPR